MEMTAVDVSWESWLTEEPSHQFDTGQPKL